MQLNKHLTLDTIVKSNNLVKEMNEDDVANLGFRIKHDFQEDDDSRSEWKERYAASLKLVMQFMERKSFPWDGAANVKFPLLTTAALQYHARAYPALMKGTRPVNCRVIGGDMDGKKAARAKRVSEHMSYQVLEADEGYEEDFDKSLIVQAIMGCAFRKSRHDSVLGNNVTELVMPKDLVLNYWSKSLSTAPRFTHQMEMSHNDIQERIRRGMYVSLEDTSGEDTPDTNPSANPRSSIIDYTSNQIDGNTPPAPGDDTPSLILEHHFWFDLDGDGYREPYIGTVHADTGQLLRLVARFENDKVERNEAGDVVRIVPEQYFTQLIFIPAPDGSVYGLGFGALLGASNEVINTIINMLLDAGQMATLGGGFLARGVKIRGGDYSFKPQTWKRTDSTSDDLKNGIYPLPVRDPSPVLLQLLTLMVEWGSKIGMATDALTGENPGQNQKVGTTQEVVKQGEKVFNGIYKRTYRALKHEFRLLYRLNYLNPPPDGKFKYSDGAGGGGEAMWTDYFDSDKGVVPSADPTIASPEANLQRWTMVRQMAGSVPGYNKYLIDKNILDIMEIPGVDQILPPPGTPGAPPPPVPPQLQIQQLKMQVEQAKLQAKMMEHRDKLDQTKRLNEAKILQLQSAAALNAAKAGTEEGKRIAALMDQEVQMMQGQQSALEQMLGHANDMISQTQQAQQAQGGPQDGTAPSNDGGAVGGMAQPGGNQAVSPLPPGGGA